MLMHLQNDYTVKSPPLWQFQNKLCITTVIKRDLAQDCYSRMKLASVF